MATASAASKSICTTTKPMKWTESHDILLAREVLVSSIYEIRNGSVERGKEWDKIVENLNALESPKFYVSKRAIRDRLNLLIKGYRAKVREEGQSSGISPDEDEIDSLLEEICDKEEEWMLNPPITSKVKKAENDRATANEIRLQALETVGETTKRKEKNEREHTTKRRKSTGEAIEYLKEKAKADLSLKEREFELREKEQSNSALLLQNQSQMQQDMLIFMQQQHQEQKRQQQLQQQQHAQTMQQMFQQQQMQSQALMALLEKFANK